MELRNSIQDFCRASSATHCFILRNIEWDQLKYLIDITKPFSFLTTSIGVSKGPTIQHCYRVYDILFSHLLYCRTVLERKKNDQPWVGPLIIAIDAAFAKLHVYFDMTYQDLGTYYGIGTLLAPQYKSEVFKGKTWIHGSSIDLRYTSQLQKLFEYEYKDYATTGRMTDIIRQEIQLFESHDPLSVALQHRNRAKEVHQTAATDELSCYLRQCKLY